MRRAGLVRGAAGLAAAAGLGGWLGWLWWPPRPEEPGFRRLDLAEIGLWIRPEEVEARGPELRVRGPEAVIWLESSRRLGPVLFQLRGDPQAVTVSSGGSRKELRPRSPDAGTNLFMEWLPGEPRRYGSAPDLFFYRLALSFPERTAGGSGGGDPRLAFLGTRELLDRDLYGVEWLGCGTPAAVRRGEEFPVLARLTNTSPHTWPHQGAARVRLAARWVGGGGPADEARADLEAPAEPGAELALWLRPRAPDRPGSHTLELDLEFEPLTSFSEKGATTCRASVRVE